jgi:hypothetical protein
MAYVVCVGAMAAATIAVPLAWIEWPEGSVYESPLVLFGLPFLALVVGVPVSAWRRDGLAAFLIWALPTLVGIVLLDWVLILRELIESSGYLGCDFDDCQGLAAAGFAIGAPAYLALVLLFAAAILRGLIRGAVGPPADSATA